MKVGILRYGISGHDRYGKNIYKKMKEHGFDCIDYGAVHDGMWMYSLSEEEFLKKIESENTLLKGAGIEVSQVHGPWRFPPRDNTPEDLDDRMMRMKKSIRFTSMLYCKNLVIHPLIPYGIEDKGTPSEKNLGC